MENSVTRRDLLKSAALGAAGVVTGATAGSVTFVKQSEAQEAGTGDAHYEVYHTDVLLVGGGASAVWAAQPLLDAGRQIMVVDKAPFRHSGTSGMSWDCQFLWYADPSVFFGTLADRNIWQPAIDYIMQDKNYDPLLDQLNHGQTMPARTEDSSFLPNRYDCDTIGTFFRREMDDMYLTGGVSVMDEVMVTDLLVNGTRCLGAIGLHLPSGTLRVIRANATMLACNAAMPFRGRHTIGYYGVGSLDNTGDVQMALWRHGVGLSGSEFGGYDVFSTEPIDLAHTMGASLMVDASAYTQVYDANHERLFPDEQYPDGIGGSNDLECTAIVKAVYEEGRGTENNRVYAHLAGADDLTYYKTKNVGLLREFGYDAIDGWVEIYPEMYEHGGQPNVDRNMMCELEGLFNPRGANALGSFVPWVSVHNKILSKWTGKCMVDYLKSDVAINDENIDWSPVIAEQKRLDSIRTAKSESGIRPYELRAKIQDAGGRGFDYYRPTPWMEEAIAEFERIRKEDLPRQTLSSESTTYNMEWKLAIENINLLDAAEMSVRASLMREESRNCYRPEFPATDDENWRCMIVCHNVNGEMVFERQEIPEYIDE